jgi:MOSC domain-containing protein YiiM
MDRTFELLRFYISAGHNFFGHSGRPAGDNPLMEVDELDCVTGRGIRGDRFFDHKNNYKGQITFFTEEAYNDLCAMFQVWDKDPGVFRRNVITRGVDLNELIGKEFVLQGIHFLGTEESRPCYWLNQAFHPGTEEALRGRGGLRARILRGGSLRKTATNPGQQPSQKLTSEKLQIGKTSGLPQYEQREFPGVIISPH